MEAPASSVVMEEHQQRQQPTTTEVDDAKNGVDGEGATAPAQPPSHPRSGPPIGTFAQQAPAPTAPPTSPPPLPPRLDALPLLAPKPQQEQHGEVPSERQAALAALDEEEIDDDALSLSEEEEGSAVVGVAKEEEGAAAVGGGMKRKRGRPPGSGAGPKPRSHENVKLPPCLKGVELVGPSVQAHIIEWVRTDNGPKTLPTQYDYVRRLARFFTRMQTEPSLAPHLLKDGADGTKQFVVHDSLEALRAALLVPPVARYTNDFRTFAREKADKAVVNMLLRILSLKDQPPYGAPVPEHRHTLPDTLNGVHLLSPSLQTWLIERIRADPTRSENTKCRYVAKLTDMLTLIQVQPALSIEPAATAAPTAPPPALVPPAEGGEALGETGAAAAAAAGEGDSGVGGEEQGGEEGGEVVERRPLWLEDAEALRAFFLRPSVKQWVLGQYQRSLVREPTTVYLLDLLGLKMTKRLLTYDDIVVKVPGRKRGPAKSPVPPLPEGVQGAAAAAATAEAEGQGDEETESDDELIVEMSDDDL